MNEVNGLPETIADFIKLRRTNAEVLEKAAGGMPNQFQRYLIADLRDEADRIEAAYKRELGNAQKMRDILVKAHTMLKVCDWSEGVDRDGVALLMHEIESALAAPPRLHR